MAATEGYWFRSTRFAVTPGEDMEVNPGIYGRQLAYWLRDGLAVRGYPEADVVPEDWGWCVICQRRPYRLWVGCASVADAEEASSTGSVIVAVRSEVRVWHCFTMVERNWLSRVLGRGKQAALACRRLDDSVRAMLVEEALIELIDEP